MRHHTRFGLALAGAALLLFTSACDSADNTDPMTTSRAIQVDSDLDLRSELLRISGSRESARLADLTPWSWTEVYVFAEGATAETIAAQTGSRIIDQDTGTTTRGTCLSSWRMGSSSTSAASCRTCL